MRTLFLLFTLLFLNQSIAQDRYAPKFPELFKTIPLKQENDPIWVRALYSSEPNIIEINKAFKTYFKQKPTGKTMLAQNYVYFFRQIENLGYKVDRNGMLSNPNQGKKFVPAKVKEGGQIKKFGSSKKYQDNVFTPYGPITNEGDWYTKENNIKSSHGTIYSLYVFEDQQKMVSYTEGGGIYLSQNGGEEWLNITPKNKISRNHDQNNVTITADEINNVIYVSFGEGIYSSSNFGSTWDYINTPGYGDIVKILFARDKLYYSKIMYSNLIYMENKKSGLYELNNEKASLVLEGEIWDFEMPKETDIIYLAKKNNGETFFKFYKSEDNGGSFKAANTNWPMEDKGAQIIATHFKIAYSKANPNIVYAGILGDINDDIDDVGWVGFFKSEDGGDNWTNQSETNELGGPYSPNNPCIVCNDQNGGIQELYFQGWFDFDIEVSDLNPNLVWVGGIRLSESRDGGKTWLRPFVGHDDTQDIVSVSNALYVASDGGINYNKIIALDTLSFPNNNLPKKLNNEWGGNETFASIFIENDAPIHSININVDIEHSNLESINISIISPENKEVLLVGTGSLKGENLQATFTSGDVYTDFFIYMDEQPYGGVYNAHFWREFKKFNNQSTNGEWKLKIQDYNYDKEQGSLNNFNISIIQELNNNEPSSALPTTTKNVKTLNNGIHDSEFVGFGIGNSKLVMVGGTWHNGNKAFNSEYEKGKYQNLFGIEEATGYVNQGDNNIVGAQMSYGVNSYQVLKISDSINIRPKELSSFSIAPNESTSAADKSDFETHPLFYNRVYFGKHNKLYKSENFGIHSQEIYSFGDEEDNAEILNFFGYSVGNIIADVKISRKNPNIIFTVKKNHYSTSLVEGGTSYLYKSIDGGKSFNKINLPFSDFNGDLNIDINDSERLFISSSEHMVIYYSDNYGDSFNLLNNLNEMVVPADLIAIDGTNKVIVYENVSYESTFEDNSPDNFVIKPSKSSDKIYLVSQTEIEELTNETLPAYVQIREFGYFYGSGKIYFASNAGIWESSASIEKEEEFLYPLVEKEIFFDEETIKLSSYTNVNTNLIHKYEWVLNGKSFFSSDYLLNLEELKPTFQQGESTILIDLQLKLHLNDGNILESEIYEKSFKIEKKITPKLLNGVNKLLFKDFYQEATIDLLNCEPIPLATDESRRVTFALDLKTQTLALTSHSFFEDENTVEASGSDNVLFIENFIKKNSSKILLASYNSLIDYYSDYFFNSLKNKGHTIDKIVRYTDSESNDWLPNSIDDYDVVFIYLEGKPSENDIDKLKNYIKDPDKKTIILGKSLSWKRFYATDIGEDPTEYPTNELMSLANMSFSMDETIWPLTPSKYYPYSLFEHLGNSEKACLDINRDGVLDKSTPEDLDGDGVRNELDECPGTIEGTMVDFKGCEVFSLPANNYSIKNIANSCAGANNGSLSIEINDNAYEYTLEVPELNASYSINAENGHELILDDLNAGLYTLVFKVVGQDAYSQIFEVQITEPAPLQAKTNFDLNGKSGFIALAGADTYFIEVNGQLSTIRENLYHLDLKPGLNTIKVSTPLDCQGVFQKEIFITESLTYYPNPVTDVLHVIIPGKDAQVAVRIFTDGGQKIMERQEEVSFDRSILLNLNKLSSGVYIVNINGKSVHKEFKIIKK